MVTKSNDPGSPKVTERATEARQGEYGKPVFVVLVCGILLALLVWGGVEIWGESIDSDSKSSTSTKTDPINAQPSGTGTFDNDPADGSSRPPEATDRSPTPGGSGSGPTQVTTPSGAEKTK
jgi:cytoskeletal protein RodZ